MKHTIEFLIEFISEIEKNPALYNHTLPDYSNRFITEVIWARIGEKFDESGEECKSKWKSIRSAYIRTLSSKAKGSSGYPKDYYLAQYLQFLNAHTTKLQHDNINIKEAERLPTDSKHESQTEELSNVATNHDISTKEEFARHETSSQFSSNFRTQSPQSSGSRKQLSEADRCAIEYFTLKKKKLESRQSEKQDNDPCRMFLLSLVPHMESMSQLQQLQFQRGVLELIGKIKFKETLAVD